MEILKFLAGLLTGGAGAQIGGAVSWVAQMASAAAVIGPAALWLTGHNDDVFVTLTYGHIALAGALMFMVLRLVHRAPPPGQ